MIDIEHYKRLFFNEETGKERYGLVPKEAEKICKDYSLEQCWEVAMTCYQTDLYYIQMLGVYLMGLISFQCERAFGFLKNDVSRNPHWQVQEFLGMAFDSYCKNIGYEKVLPTIDEWLNDRHQNVRRAVTEGLRIWTKRPFFRDNPDVAVIILSEHKTDESEYVRKSVGNALKDISKEFPELIKEEVAKWVLDSKAIDQVYRLAISKIKSS